MGGWSTLRLALVAGFGGFGVDTGGEHRRFTMLEDSQVLLRQPGFLEILPDAPLRRRRLLDRALPEGVLAAVGGWAIGVPWFARRVLLQHWFLHAGEP